MLSEWYKIRTSSNLTCSHLIAGHSINQLIFVIVVQGTTSDSQLPTDRLELLEYWEPAAFLCESDVDSQISMACPSNHNSPKNPFGSSTFKTVSRNLTGRGFYFEKVERLFENIPKWTCTCLCSSASNFMKRLSHTGIYSQSKHLEYLGMTFRYRTSECEQALVYPLEKLIHGP